MAKPLKIVHLDGVHCPSPTFTIPHTYTEYPNTTDLSTIASRIGDADVVITTRIPITASTLDQCPGLKLIAVQAIGTDMIDLAACKARNVVVTNVPAASNESVAEHAIALYFAIRRNITGMHEMMVQGDEWVKKGAVTSLWTGVPRTCREEVMGIIGGGELGNRVAAIGRALGMTVQISERKSVAPSSTRPSRIPFPTVLQTSTILMITLPLTPSTHSLISTPEFALMRPDAILINVARGGIVDEDALVDALRENRIAGAAADVFSREPAGRENVLVREGGMGGRLVLSPHVAWFARSSIEKLRRTVVENIEAWVGGEVRNVVV